MAHDCDCEKLGVHANIFTAVLDEYERQVKGGGVSPSVSMLRSMMDGKIKGAKTAAAREELRKQLIEVSAASLKMLEGL